jgi:putative heme-binding domain-containing protein
VATAWPQLAHADRFIRYAARVAIEHQPISAWQDRALAEREPPALILASIALARCGEKSLQPRIAEALNRLDFQTLSEEDRLGLLRAYGLVFARLGSPSAEVREAVLAKTNQLFPTGSPNVDRELSQLLIYLEAPQIARRCLERLTKASTQEEAIHYAFALRALKGDWSLDDRKAYFAWFNDSAQLRGGHSFAGFLRNAKNEAVALLAERDKSALASVLEPPTRAADAPPPAADRPIVREWTVGELAPGIDQALRGRDFQRGRQLFAAASCFKCHRFAGEGGIIGPDVTGVGNRFTNEYLLESLIEPSKTVSDQYQASVFVLRDGRTIVGKVANLNGDNLMVITDMLEPGRLTSVNRRQIEEQRASPVSMMPSGLLNTLSRDEILDLLAYLRSGGNADHEVFR